MAGMHAYGGVWAGIWGIWGIGGKGEDGEAGFPLHFLVLLLFCLAGRCILAVVPSFSVLQYPAPCSTRGSQVNYTTEVGGEPSIVTRLSTASPRDHSLDVVYSAQKSQVNCTMKV